MAAPDGLENLLRHFRGALRADPVSAFRDWFRAQEELSDRGDAATARALAQELWQMLPELGFESEQARARFFHNVAVFYGSPGPAADLARARESFGVALAHFSEHEESGWHARALHNFATALSNLGETPAQLEESIQLFERALAWRTPERAIARGVTLHNMGIVLRRLAELDPGCAAQRLEESAAALREAVAIRQRLDLAEGHALSLFHLALTRERLGQAAEAQACFQRAAEAFDQLGKHDSASIARSRLAGG
jgi:tetratricopeptide (TPR) repeat protein